MSQNSGRQTVSEPTVPSDCLENVHGAEHELSDLRDAGFLEAPRHLRISVNEMTTCPWSFEEDVLHYREMGVEGIGIWLPKLSDCDVDRAVDVLLESGLAVTSVSSAGGFTGTHGYSFEDAVADALDAIELSRKLQAECLVILSGPRSLHIKTQMYRLLVDGLRKLADVAADHGVVLAVKPMHVLFASQWTFLNSLDQTLEVLDRVEHPAVKLAFDVYHLWQEPRLLERIPEIVPRVATVQLSDWREPPRSDNDHCLLGTGEIPLELIVDRFLKSGYQGFFDVQMLSESLWRRDCSEVLHHCLAYLRSICADMRRHAHV